MSTIISTKIIIQTLSQACQTHIQILDQSSQTFLFRYYHNHLKKNILSQSSQYFFYSDNSTIMSTKFVFRYYHNHLKTFFFQILPPSSQTIFF